MPQLLLVVACSVALILAGSGCGRGDDATGAAPLPKVSVSKPMVREIVEWDEYTGRLQAFEEVEVRPRVSGYVQSIHFPDGGIV